MTKIKTMSALVSFGANNHAVVTSPIQEITNEEILCKVKACAICGTDPGLFSGNYISKNWPPEYPIIFGHEWSGEIVEVGKDVVEFDVGDRVAGEAHCGCGRCENCKNGNYTLCLNYGITKTGHRHYGFLNNGAYAEYIIVNVKAVSKIPDNISFDEATMCDTGGVALHGVNNAKIEPNGTVVIFGPGPIGIIAMQICKSRGCRVITIGRGDRLKMAKAMGSDEIIDYEKSNPVKEVLKLTAGKGADSVIDCAGSKNSAYNSLKCSKKNGHVSLVALYNPQDDILPVDDIVMNQIHVHGSRANPNCSDKFMELISRKKIVVKDLITHRFTIKEIDTALDIFANKKEGVMKVIIYPK